jgi:hypothetical protein
MREFSSFLPLGSWRLVSSALVCLFIDFCAHFPLPFSVQLTTSQLRHHLPNARARPSRGRAHGQGGGARGRGCCAELGVANLFAIGYCERQREDTGGCKKMGREGKGGGMRSLARSQPRLALHPDYARLLFGGGGDLNNGGFHIFLLSSF